MLTWVIIDHLLIVVWVSDKSWSLIISLQIDSENSATEGMRCYLAHEKQKLQIGLSKYHSTTPCEEQVITLFRLETIVASFFGSYSVYLQSVHVPFILYALQLKELPALLCSVYSFSGQFPHFAIVKLQSCNAYQ